MFQMSSEHTQIDTAITNAINRALNERLPDIMETIVHLLNPTSNVPPPPPPPNYPPPPNPAPPPYGYENHTNDTASGIHISMVVELGKKFGGGRMIFKKKTEGTERFLG
ncbi:hypothetical protein R6Q57_013759 [Mikania cordata]